MKRTMLGLLAATALAAAIPAIALAQPGGDRYDSEGRNWQSINQRQANLDARIDAGIRDRSLTPAEAARLRAEFQDIVRLEAQDRASPPGLTREERADLDRRMDDLDRRIRVNSTDNDVRGGGRDWQSISQRQANLDARIDAGIRDRSLTPGEAARLRAEFQAIVRQEDQYRASPPGLTRDERADLDRRMDDLDRRIRVNRNDDDSRWSNLDQRQAQFNERLDRAVRDRRISRRESINLRREFDQIAQLERRYRLSPPGITPPERADLNARFSRMQADYRAAVRTNGPFDDVLDQLFGATRR
jgi:hypothetical protein